MAAPKKLVLFVEGPGDQAAAPVLVKKLLTEIGGWDALRLGNDLPWKVGGVESVTKGNGAEWQQKLRAVHKQKDLGAVLLLLDGDHESIRKETFCPVVFARRLAEQAREAGGGTQFSVACAFALREYESWFIACADRLAGQRLPDNREGMRGKTTPPSPSIDLERGHIRDAKKWVGTQMLSGYKPTTDQKPLTELMVAHLDAVRARPMRSFLRLERAVSELVDANRTGTHVVSPVKKPPVPSAGADPTDADLTPPASP